MTRNQWITAAIGAIAVVVVVFVVIGIFTTTGDNQADRQTRVTIEQEQQPDRAASEEGAGPADTAQPDASARSGVEVNVEDQNVKPAQGENVRKGDRSSANNQNASGQSVTQQVQRVTTGANNRPGMLELGADWCPPCKEMKPIISNLQNKYKGKVDIVSVDVDQYPDLAKKYNIKAIPTQIFYNKQGKQVYRHEGFLSRDDIESQFGKMGVSTS